MNIDWLEVELRVVELGLDLANLAPEGLLTPDYSASLGQLWSRHRKRYQQCPEPLRPSGFGRYLARYYAWCWQTKGAFHWILTALKQVGRHVAPKSIPW